MSATSKALSRGLLSGSSATLYTVPAATTAIITNIVLANTSTSSVTVTINLDGVALIPGISVDANSVTEVAIRQSLAATKTITGFASTASVVGCHISGAEVA